MRWSYTHIIPNSLLICDNMPFYAIISNMLFWRRHWHPTPVLLPGKSYGRRSLQGCSPWGRWGSDKIERLHFHFHFHALEKEMATPSSVLAWRIPGTGEPGGLPSMGSHRVRHDWGDLAAAAALQILLSLGGCNGSTGIEATIILGSPFQRPAKKGITLRTDTLSHSVLCGGAVLCFVVSIPDLCDLHRQRWQPKISPDVA